MIDTMQYLYTEPKEFKEIDGNIEQNLDIIFQEKITVIPAKVLLKIDVEKYTEKEIKVPIQIRNKPNNVNVKLFPSDINLICLVGLSEFETLNASNFNVAVDFKEITAENKNLTVQVVSMPSNVELVRFSPESVEFLIETN